MDSLLRPFEPLVDLFVALFSLAYPLLVQTCQRQIYLPRGLYLLKLQETHSLYKSFQEYRKEENFPFKLNQVSIILIWKPDSWKPKKMKLWVSYTFYYSITGILIDYYHTDSNIIILKCQCASLLKRLIKCKSSSIFDS